MLKDIFPQNAVDIGLMKKSSFIFKYFKRKEKLLYEVFTIVDTETFLDLDKILLEKILFWELKICFVNWPDKIAILNRWLSVSNKIENILIQ